MKVIRILCSIILTVVCLFQSDNLTLSAQESWPAGPEVLGESAIVMEANSGAILYEKNSHQQVYPASITKIMTALLAVENKTMNENVTFSYDSVHKTEGSSIWRDVDEVMTMEQCLYALMLNSANECAYAIAEYTGSGYDGFVKMMNDRAKALGCKDTNFTNPHGLPDEQHYTSAYDMALIAREAIKNPNFRQITSTIKYTIPATNKHPDENTYLSNHHKMLQPTDPNFYEYCIGGKTGYTQAAGNTLVTYAEKDGMTLVCVAMKEQTPDHYTDTRALLDYCFDNFRIFNIKENEMGYSNNSLPDSGFLTGDEFVTIGDQDGIVLPVGAEFKDAAMEVISGNQSKDVAGTLQFTYAKRVVGQTDIKATGEKMQTFSFGKIMQGADFENKTVKINITVIIWIILGVLALVAIGFCIYRFRDRLPALGGRLSFRRRERQKRVVIGKKQRRRRRK